MGVSFGDLWEERFGRREPRVVGVGMNYHDHAAEQGVRPPEVPVLFAKLSNSLRWHEDPIVLPAESAHVDGEAELAVVIGKRAARVTVDAALDAIYGYTCANDVSARDIQFSDSQWFRAKSFDSFCPIGPELVPLNELGDASRLRIRQRVNGETLQDSLTSEMVFGVRELVSFVSETVTLDPGDVILTGTPAGVGFFREPRLALAPGDVVEVDIEGIGTLRNRVVDAQGGSD